MATPEYRTLEATFIAPHYIHAGSVIRTEGPPGPHLQPLNEEARSRMEEWLKEPHPEKDDKGKLTGQTHTPHEQYRRPDYVEADTHTVEIVSGPPKDQPGSLDTSLAAAANLRPSTDQRPGPAPVFADGSSAGVPPPSGAVADNGAVIVEAAPPPAPATLNPKK